MLAMLEIATSVSCSYVCLYIRACMCACLCVLMGICNAVCLGPVNASNFWPIMVWHISCSTLSNYVKGWIFFSIVFYPFLSLCVIVSLSSHRLCISVLFFFFFVQCSPSKLYTVPIVCTYNTHNFVFISTI